VDKFVKMVCKKEQKNISKTFEKRINDFNRTYQQGKNQK